MGSKLKFVDYIVDKIDFKNNYLTDEEFRIDFDINSEITLDDNNKFFVKLSVDLFNKKPITGPFSMKIDVIGIFEIDDMSDKELKNDIIEKNSIAILFPYVRAIISNYTALANVPPLILPPINVVEYINRKNKK